MHLPSSHRRFPRPGLLAAAAGALLLGLAPGVTLAASGVEQTANIPWYLSRATGLVAYLLLFCTVVLGLAVRTKTLDRLVARWRVTDVHIFLSILVIVFVAVHAAVLLTDSYIGFSAVEILVPFASPYLPVWTGLGIIAAYLLLIVAVSFPARRITGYRFWRALHYVTFAVYAAALAHGLFTGTDTHTLWAQAIYVGTAGIVLTFVLYRILTWRRRALADLLRPRGRTANGVPGPAGGWNAYPRPVAQAMASTALGGGSATEEALEERRGRIDNHASALILAATGVGAVLLFTAGIGPFHWGSGGGASADLTGGATAAQRPTGFKDTYTGEMARSSGRRGGTSLHIEAQGQRPVTLDLQMAPAQGGFGHQTATQGSATLTDQAGAVLCSGAVSSFTGGGFVVDCDGSGPYAGMVLSLQGTIDSATGSQVQGSLSATVSPATGV
jgi:hypothetical protein